MGGTLYGNPCPEGCPEPATSSSTETSFSSSAVTDSTTAVSARESSGPADAGSCDAKTQYEMVSAGAMGGSTSCEPLPAACTTDVTCACVEMAVGYAPGFWPCDVASTGLVVIEEEPP